MTICKFSRLTPNQRYQIFALLKEEKTVTEIAKNIGFHHSTVSREIKRNSLSGKYQADEANEKAFIRRKEIVKPKKLSSELWDDVKELLGKEWSPEQISGYRKMKNLENISHERIYQFIWQDKKEGGVIYKSLRHGNKRYRKRGAKKDKRGQIIGRIPIDKRPAIVEQRERIGDWEIDTVIGKDHKESLVTIVERKTNFTVIKHLKTKEAQEVTEATIKMLEPFKDKVKTITADNGREFAYHEKIATALSALFFFARPYHSWERGTNENTNGLIRQYFKKGTSFESITEEDVKEVQDKLNSRPRKKLGFKTPNEAFLGAAS